MKSIRRKTKSNWVSELAKKRIMSLFNLAEEVSVKNPERARRYIELARKISSRYNVSISQVFPDWKMRICKKCSVFWFSGKNVKIRSNPKTKAMEYRCLNCGFIKRFGYK